MSQNDKQYIWADGKDILMGAHEADAGIIATAVSEKNAKWIVEQLLKAQSKEAKE